MVDFADLPEPDRVEGAPHPREAPALFGQTAAEAAFLTAYRSGRMHSGWLLTGPKGIGKATLAYRIACFLLAEEPDTGDSLFGTPPPPESLALPDDHPVVRQVRAGSHPRLCIVRRGPNDKGDRISQDIRAVEVRKLKDFFHLSATDGGRRVVIVDAADELNPSAANALLKELEEPPARTTLLLLSHQPARLLPTIRSRCRTLRLSPLGPADLARALAAAGVTVEAPEALAVLAGGSVGAALSFQDRGGLALYGELVHLLSHSPGLDRPAAIRLGEACAGKAGEARYALTLDLFDLLLARAARTGLSGEPQTQGAPGEARLLTRLSPDDRAARVWADLQAHLGARARHGRAVNLDPAALILDILLAIDDTARRLTPA